MAKYRQVHVHIWKDGWFLDLEPKYKLFFIYLFTNERASISGIYELPKRVMAFESGLTYSEIDSAFEVFQQEAKAYFDDGVVWIANLRKYHESKSPKVQKCIADDIGRLKNCKLKAMYMELYSIDSVSDTVSIPRSSYSISSRDSSKIPDVPIHSGSHNELAPEDVPHYQHNEERRVIISALSGIVKEVFMVGDPKLDMAADALLSEGATEGGIARFAKWWKSNGHYNGKPALKSVLQNYKEAQPKQAASKDWGHNALHIE